ncbi:MAG: thiolase family protein [Spirochaetia bacterium]|nr:thiolase family protein [Spirochaetia bacterium]
MNFTKDNDKLVIVAAVRTPIGQAGKSLSSYQSHELGIMVAEEAIKRSGIDKKNIDGVVAGEIGQSSRAPNVARVILVKNELPLESTAVTVANNCVSGFEAINEACRRILLGENTVELVVGLESMSNFPIYLSKAQQNSKTATVEKIRQNWQMIPEIPEVEMISAVDEGLVDPVRKANMAETGEVVAQMLGLSKKQLDEYAAGSYRKTLEAIQAGKYKPWLMPVKSEKGSLEDDEFIMSKTGFVEKPERFEKAAAIFDMPPHTNMKDFYAKYGKWIGKPYTESVKGAVSLFNACPRSDGAGALMITTESRAKQWNCKILAHIRGWGNYGVDPIYMGLGITHSMKKALDNAGLSWSDMDSFEIHEAFAATALGSIMQTKDIYGFDLFSKLGQGKINPNGGTLAMGHPLGATGIRIAMNQIMEMQLNPAVKLSIGGICAGGGVGGALILER